MKDNLTFKNIKDFQAGDPIYLHHSSYSGGMINKVLLCEFVSFEKGKVTGKVISVDSNPSLHKHKIEEGWFESVRLQACSLYGKGPNDNHSFYHFFDPLGYAIYENYEERHMRVPEKHPSYGMVSISRCSSSHPTACFGSPILHQHTMRLRIHTAKLERSLHRDSYFTDKEIIEVEMTPQQFTDMLTNPNSSGTPITIKHLNHEIVEPTPFLSKLDQFESELKEKIKSMHSETKQKLNSINELLQKKSLTNKDREHINREIQGINQEVESNLPFLQSQMIEEMGKVVGEAKGAITNFLQEECQRKGLPPSTNLPLMLETPTDSPKTEE